MIQTYTEPFPVMTVIEFQVCLLYTSADGGSQIQSGSSQLYDGSKELRDGMTKLKDGRYV